MKLKKHVKLLVVFFWCCIFFGCLCADEGMWTFDNIPVQKIEKDYGFMPDANWIEAAQKAPVRVGSSSGAFVSAKGLIITNQHVAMGQLQKMSTLKKDYLNDGFYAKNMYEEIPCPDLELKILQYIEDVTDRVIKSDSVTEEIARIEKESYEKTGMYSQVVNLYNGGKYQLQRFKKYTDVRLVMAPEFNAAQFGGEYDNYTYPRYSLDFTFLRAYENGKPLRPTHYFKWNEKGVSDGELVFVSGNPASTHRLKTLSQLEYDKNYYLPDLLELDYFLLDTFLKYSRLGTEWKHRAQKDIYSIRNYIKRYEGMYNAIRDRDIMTKKKMQEKDLKDKAAKLKDKVALKAFKNIEKMQSKRIKNHKKFAYYDLYSHGAKDGYRVFGIINRSALVKIARTIVLYTTETKKPAEKRYAEFGDSKLESLMFKLFSPAPVYPQYEEHILASAFEFLIKKLGADDPYVKAVLGRQTPKSMAHMLVSETKLISPEFRKKLIKGGSKTVEKCADPMIVWMRGLDTIYRNTRKQYETEIKKIEAKASSKIAKTRFDIYGTETYPDANSSQRLTYGRAIGYELGTTLVPYKTTFYDLYGRAANFNGKEPFTLTKKLSLGKNYIDMSTPLNFVTTTDTVGGNSGSPVFNKNLQYLGIVFDRNIQGLDRTYLYIEKAGRTVSVSSAAITEVLEKAYGMKWLVRELLGK